ncbi:MAG: hypothetical protein QXP01_00195 [Candidatus Hadarchaeum sp.]
MDDAIRFRCREEGDWLCFWADLGEQFSPARARRVLERNAVLPFFRYGLQENEGLVLRAELLAGEATSSRVNTLLAVGRREIQWFRAREGGARGGSYVKSLKPTRECIRRAKESILAACEEIGAARYAEKEGSAEITLVTRDERRYSIQVDLDRKLARFELNLCQVEALTPEQERALLLWAARMNGVVRYGGLALKKDALRARVCTMTELLSQEYCRAAIHSLITMRPLAQSCAALLDQGVAAEYLAVTGASHRVEHKTT